MKQSHLFSCTALALSLSLVPIAYAKPANQDPLYLSSVAELEAALVDDNAGRRLVLQSGVYAIDVPLVVPDGVSLEGEGIMLTDGLPTGFEPGTETTIVAANPFAGDLLTLGDGAQLRGLQIEQPFEVAGNVVTVKSRAPGDTISASIVDCELISDNVNGIGPDGPVGGGVLVFTRNPNPFGAPPPHDGSDLALRMDNSIVQVTPGANAVFGINFSSLSSVTISLARNRLNGTLNIVGGVSRFDQVSGSATMIYSDRNLYEGTPIAAGMQIQGGAAPPVPVPAPGSNDNYVYVSSSNDRIEGFGWGILAAAAGRFNDTTGPSSRNTVDLRIRGLSLDSQGAGAADLSLFAAQSSGQYSPGDNNTLLVLIRDTTGSGPTDNRYGATVDDIGDPLPSNLGSGNRLELSGNQRAFDQANANIIPLPPTKFFAGGLKN
jgi:hypothetical protein